MDASGKIARDRSQAVDQILTTHGAPPQNVLSKHDWIFVSSFLVVFVLGSFLLLKNLDNQLLWQDEAETALLAKTILSHGVPMGYDGKNYFSQQAGADYGKDYVWITHAWLPFYWLAAFFGIFGISTFTARFPFALFGIATIGLTYLLSESLFKTRRVGLIASVLLVLSVPFLVLSRQCRYYSLAAFFTLLGLYCYLRLTENKKHASLAFVSVCTVLIHVHYIYYGVVLMTVCLHALIFNRTIFYKVTRLAILTVLINSPWILWISPVLHGRGLAPGILSVDLIFDHARDYLVQLFKYVFPLPMLLLSFGVLAFYKRKNTQDDTPRKNLWLLILLVAISIAALSLAVPQLFFRYLTPLIPASCLILALVVEGCIRFHKVVGIAAIILFAYLQPMHDYLYELTHDYNGPVDGIVKYLNQHGRKDDTVAITYGDLPLKFYTDMRVIGGLTGEDLSLVKEPDWVIIRKYVLCQIDQEVGRYLTENIPWHKYEKITIDSPDLPWENREDPAEHHFRTVTDEDRVIIHKKIKS